ncbi:MAG: hypothetical protein M3680_25160 [Myxococcota bacterium]|nr:hypothetical protein [Myxococcota bacterium]
MSRELITSLIVIAISACSAHPPPRRSPDQGPTETADRARAQPGPTDRECDDLFAHAIAIRIAEQRRTLPPDQVPTEAEQATLRAELRAGYLESCRAGSRGGLQCGLVAKTLDELAACHSTPSSSTSNSSVAPPGITPAAPRSP